MKHISYSQYNTYVSCPRSWYLGKVRQAQEVQTWYIPIGSAVHDMVEAELSGPSPRSEGLGLKAEDFFYPLIERQMLIEPDLSKWLAGGPKGHPIVEELALQVVKDCFEQSLEYLDEIDIWEVEYEATTMLPGLEVPLKAFLDIIGEHKKKGPVVYDWKTGSTKPNNFQLETYGACLDQGLSQYSDVKFKGRYVMLKPGSPRTRFIEISPPSVDPAEVGAKYQAVYEQMKAKIYKTQHGFNCNFCFQQDNCLVNAGPTERAKYYDRSQEDGYPY